MVEKLETFAMTRNSDCERSESIATRLHEEVTELSQQSANMNLKWRNDWNDAESRVSQSANMMEGTLAARSAKIVLLEGEFRHEVVYAEKQLRSAERTEELYQQDFSAHAGADVPGGEYTQEDMDRLSCGLSAQISD